MKQLRLRYPGFCAGCGDALVVGAQGWWEGTTKEAFCLGCHVDAAAVVVAPVEAAPIPPLAVVLPVDPAPPAAAPVAMDVVETPAAPLPPLPPPPSTLAPPSPTPVLGAVGDIAAGLVPLTDEERGDPGASARAERVRRTTKREDRIKAKHKRFVNLRLALAEDPTSTKVWDQGAVGEERVGAWLEAARARGIEVLHDRAVPRSTANIDHLVIAPSGIWIVDAKRYLSGKLERRDVGGWRKTDWRLFVGSRDQTKLVTGVEKQVDLVRSALAGTDFADVPVHGALCFVEIELGWFPKPFKVRDVHVTWRKHLVEPMLQPEVLDGPTCLWLTHHLAQTFKRN